MSIMSSVSVAVSMTHDDEKMKRSRVVTVGSPTLGGGEGAGRRRTITSYFVVVTSVCSLLSNGMSGMRMSNESPPRIVSTAQRAGSRQQRVKKSDTRLPAGARKFPEQIPRTQSSEQVR